jgi:hypothetical protein
VTEIFDRLGLPVGSIGSTRGGRLAKRRVLLKLPDPDDSMSRLTSGPDSAGEVMWLVVARVFSRRHSHVTPLSHWTE